MRLPQLVDLEWDGEAAVVGEPILAQRVWLRRATGMLLLGRIVNEDRGCVFRFSEWLGLGVDHIGPFATTGAAVHVAATLWRRHLRELEKRCAA